MTIYNIKIAVYNPTSQWNIANSWMINFIYSINLHSDVACAIAKLTYITWKIRLG